jgi:predicted transcriptional regulator
LFLELVALAISSASVMLLGLARRTKGATEQAMRHPVRRSILDLIRRRPGSRLSTIWRAFTTNRGTAQYHLLVLERVGAVRAVRDGQATRYFPSDVGPGQLPGLALLLRGRVMEVARAVLEEPGISQRRLTKILPISRKVFREYADRLAEMGLVTEVRDAKVKRYFPTPRLGQMVGQLRARPDAPLQEDDKWTMK